MYYLDKRTSEQGETYYKMCIYNSDAPRLAVLAEVKAPFAVARWSDFQAIELRPGDRLWVTWHKGDPFVFVHVGDVRYVGELQSEQDGHRHKYTARLTVAEASELLQHIPGTVQAAPTRATVYKEAGLSGETDRPIMEEQRTCERELSSL